MQVQEVYQLFFNWQGMKYSKDVATFKKAWFDGPVLARAAQIEPNNYISLDFSLQNFQTNLFLPDNFFIARLSWKDVEYKDNKVILKKCSLLHNKAGSLKELKDGFKFLIDCSQHEEYMHRKMLVYPAWVLNPEEIIE
jgi:hypothetical protein